MEYVYSADAHDMIWAEMNAEPFVRELCEKAGSLGYKVERAFRKRHGSWESVEFCTIPSVGANRYLPDVCYSCGFRREEGKFEMQTTSFGSVSGEEMHEFIAAVKNGADFVDYLSELDWSKAPSLCLRSINEYIGKAQLCVKQQRRFAAETVFQEETKMRTNKIRIDEIQLNDDRSEGGQGDVESLARNMEKYGQINPVTVVLLAGNSNIYRIVTGRRRVAAAIFLGWEEIDANVATEEEIPDEEMYALSENAAREEMNAIDEGILYAKELKRGTPVEELAALFCRNKSTVYQRAKLATLVPEMRELYKAGRLDLHIAAMAATLPEDAQKAIAEQGKKYGVGEWDVRQAISNAHDDFLSELSDCADCVGCKKRTHYSDKTLFPELSDDDDRCLDHDCFCKKLGKIITDAYDELFKKVYGKPEWDLMSKYRAVSSVAFPAGLKIGDIEVKPIDWANGETDISDEDLEVQRALGEAGKTEIVPCWNGTEFVLAVLANEDDIDELTGRGGKKSGETEWQKVQREHFEDMLSSLSEEKRAEIIENGESQDIANAAKKRLCERAHEEAVNGLPDGEESQRLRLAVSILHGFYLSVAKISAVAPEAGIEESDTDMTALEKLSEVSVENLSRIMLRITLGKYGMEPPMYGLKESGTAKIYERLGVDLIGLRDAAVAEAVGETSAPEETETDLSVADGGRIRRHRA